MVFNFQTRSLSVVDVFLCSSLKDDLCKLNLVLNSFSAGPIYVSWLFEVISVTVALYATHLVRHLLEVLIQECQFSVYLQNSVNSICSKCPP